MAHVVERGLYADLIMIDQVSGLLFVHTTVKGKPTRPTMLAIEMDQSGSKVESKADG